MPTDEIKDSLRKITQYIEALLEELIELDKRVVRLEQDIKKATRKSPYAKP